MKPPFDPSDGPTGSALHSLYELNSTVISKDFAGNLSVGTLTFPGGSGRLTSVEFALATPPAGSAAVIDVKFSLDGGVTYISATAGAGFTIPIGASDVTFLVFNVLVAYGATVELVVASVGSVTPGAGLSAALTFGAF
jgi:hypothetical protein